jgi:hypothetical protein
VDAIGDWRLFFSSQPTFGLGTGEQAQRLSNDGTQYDEVTTDGNPEGEAMDFDLIRFYQTAVKQVMPNRIFMLALGII